MKPRKRWIYAMYKGEECLAIGTTEEICKQMGIKKETFLFMRTKSYLKRRSKSKKSNYRTIIRIDNETFDE